MGTKTVIDLSKWNDIKDYSKLVKATDGVILRIGYRSSTYNGKLMEDAKFATHLAALQKLNCPIGVYFFTEAINLAEAESEALFVIDLVKGYRIDPYFPIAIDTEWCNSTYTGRSDSLSVATRTNCVVVFLEKIMSLGYQSMIYASDSWFKSNLNYAGVKPYKKWVARYSSSKPTVQDKIVGWQKSETFTISGLSGKFDMSEWYGDIGIEQSKYPYIPIVNKKEPEKKSVIAPIVLKNATLYGSATGKPLARKLTGKYYLWSSEIQNGRVRVTSRPEYVGQSGKTTGWIDYENIK